MSSNLFALNPLNFLGMIFTRICFIKKMQDESSRKKSGHIAIGFRLHNPSKTRKIIFSFTENVNKH